MENFILLENCETGIIATVSIYVKPSFVKGILNLPNTKETVNLVFGEDDLVVVKKTEPGFRTLWNKVSENLFSVTMAPGKDKKSLPLVMLSSASGLILAISERDKVMNGWVTKPTALVSMENAKVIMLGPNPFNLQIIEETDDGVLTRTCISFYGDINLTNIVSRITDPRNYKPTLTIWEREEA